MSAVMNFTELEVWKVGRRIRHKIYEITSAFPASERFNLIDQMRRAAVSMTSNLAEGFGRFSYRENKRACWISRGEASELQDHMVTCLDEKFLDRKAYEELHNEVRLFLRLLNGYIRSIGTQKKTATGDQ